MRHTQNSITPGGCVWPPLWPPRAPELPDERSEYGREFLREDFDWMCIPHPMLYRMVRDGLDLGSVVESAARWGEFGERMEQLGDDLRRSLEESAHGWQGDAAEQARATMRRLAHWTSETADRGAEISSCIARQADLAEHAKQRMPEPVAERAVQPIPAPMVDSANGGGTAAMSASSFAQGGFASAAVLPRDQAPAIEEATERHRAAAHVMRQLQRDSFDVYRDVPRFTSPDARRVQREGDDRRKRPGNDHGEGDERHRRGHDRTGGPDDTSTSSAGSPAAPTPSPVPGSPQVGPSYPGAPAPNGGQVSGGATSAPSPGLSSGELASGRRVGTAMPSAPSGSATTSTSGAPAGASRSFGGGAMPVGAAGAGSRPGGDTEHTVAEYLEEDSDFWGPAGPVVPPVIGEDPPGENDR